MRRVQYSLQRENDWDVEYLYECCLYRDYYWLFPPTCVGGSYYKTEEEAIEAFKEKFKESGCLAGSLFFSYTEEPRPDEIKLGEPYVPINVVRE